MSHAVFALQVVSLPMMVIPRPRAHLARTGKFEPKGKPPEAFANLAGRAQPRPLRIPVWIVYQASGAMEGQSVAAIVRQGLTAPTREISTRATSAKKVPTAQPNRLPAVCLAIIYPTKTKEDRQHASRAQRGSRFRVKPVSDKQSARVLTIQ